MTQLLYVVIPGHAVGKGRARARFTGKFVQHYTPAKTRRYEDLVRERAIVALGDAKPFDGAVRVFVTEVRVVPKSWSKRQRCEALEGRLHPTSRPDLDNIEKSVCDALNSVVWLDDSQVVEKVSGKTYGLEPCVAVTVEAMAQQERFDGNSKTPQAVDRQVLHPGPQGERGSSVIVGRSRAVDLPAREA